MSEKKKATRIIETDEDSEDLAPASKRSSDTSGVNHTKVMRRISPLGFRVVVRIRTADNVTDAGLYLPEGAKAAGQESLVAEVIEVASASDNQTDEETNISGVPLHSLVLIAKDSGIKVPWDDKLRIVDTKDVLGIVHEVRLV